MSRPQNTSLLPSFSRPLRALGLLALSLALVASATPSSVSAQATHARPTGEVTGVEMTLEGALSARRGGALRWLITAYEVTGTHTLRVAGGATVRLTTSLQGADDVEVTTDARGRALLTLPVPADAPGAIGVVIEVRTPHSVQRRFEVAVDVAESRALSLQVPAVEREPGDTVHALAMLTEGHSGVAVPNAELRVELRDSRGPLGATTRVNTDAGGVAHLALPIPLDAQPGRLQLRVTHMEPSVSGRRSASATGHVSLGRPSSSSLLVGVLPARVLLNSEESVPVEVLVRRPDGRPVEGAVLQHNGLHPGSRDDDPPPLVTDARGRASFVWRAPRLQSGVRESAITVQATRAGLGSSNGRVQVRAHAQDFFLASAVEGGALPASLGGRLYAIVVRADGRPAANVPVTFSGPRVGSLSGTTDASGMVRVDATLAAADPARDRCGGIASTALEITAGAGPRAGRQESCLPLDTDTQVRVRAPSIVAPGVVRLELARASSVARAPIVVTAMAAAGGALEALESVVVEGDSAELTLPDDVPAQVYFRARPLVDGREVRGSLAASWVRRSDALTPVVRFDPSGRALVSGIPAGTPFSVFALPIEVARPAFAAARDESAVAMSRISQLEAEARLARVVPLDVTAPVRQQGDGVVPQPMPEDSVARGLLRDPWRASSRFIEGRLALLFRQVEDRVQAALPNNLDDITVVERGRREFTRQVFATLDGEATTGLGGEPLTLTDVQRLDRSFSFDSVAKRITRRRLFRLLVVLRDLVRNNGLDLPWARPGDPVEWLAHLPGTHSAIGTIAPSDLVDGWGRPFVLRSLSRPRFTQLQPVAGYELASSGPDGRVGNGDDLYDPTARVLPSGGLYAQAVGEDALVARLQSVELGRATVELAGGPVQIQHPRIPNPREEPVGALPGTGGGGQGGSASQTWGLPAVIERDAHALDVRRPGRGVTLYAAHAEATAGSTPVALELGDEPRTWGVLVLARDAHGTTAVAMDSGVAGTPILMDAQVPSRVRVGEPLEVPLHVTNTSAEDATYTVNASASDGLSAQVAGSVRVPAGESRDVALTLEGTQARRASLELSVAREGQALRSQRAHVVVDRGRHPIRRWGTGVAHGDEYRVDLRVPRDAVDPVTRVVLLGPAALADDPALTLAREEQPGAIAWAAVSAGRGVPEALRASLVRQQSGAVALSERAARVVSLTHIVSLDNDDAEARTALHREQAQLGRAVGRLTTRQAAIDVATAFAVLAAGGVPEEDSRDPLANFMTSARTALRRTLFVHRGDPAVLARVAAALLIADPEDGYGIAMLDRASAQSRLRAGARRVVVDEELARGSEVTGATLALALASHQVGRTQERDELLRGAMQTFGSVSRAPADALLYWFALSAYGALGHGDPEGLEVNVGHGWQATTLENGRATLQVSLSPGERLRARVRTRGGAAVFARVETVFGATFEDRDDAPFALAIQGDVGRVGGVAGLVLEVRAGERAVPHPVIELQLPAGVDGDEELERAFASLSVVQAAEARRPGFMRLTLVPLNAEQVLSVPLAFPWISGSPVRGLGAVGYEASHPTRMTVLPPTTLRPQPAEEGLR